MAALDLPDDPYPEYARLRREDPVHRDEDAGHWEVYRHADARRVLMDHRSFSSERAQLRQDRSVFEPTTDSLIAMDPPRQQELRALIADAFSARSIAGLRPGIEAITEMLLRGPRARGGLDVVDELAYPLPTIVIATLLGIGAEEHERFIGWGRVIMETEELGPRAVTSAAATAAARERRGRLQEDMLEHFGAVIAARRRQPEDDLITLLLSAETGGRRLTEAELLGFCGLLVLAGHITTTSLIANAVLCLLAHPEVEEEVRGDARLMPAFVEEVLRWLAPVQRFDRRTTTDVEVAGTTVPADTRVIACIGSANRDEARFEDAESFVIDRPANPHLGFGHGVHACIGAPLARLEAAVAIAALLGEGTRLRPAWDQPLERVPSFLMYGVRHLPVALD